MTMGKFSYLLCLSGSIHAAQDREPVSACALWVVLQQAFSSASARHVTASWGGIISVPAWRPQLRWQ